MGERVRSVRKITQEMGKTGSGVDKKVSRTNKVKGECGDKDKKSLREDNADK
ncbi:hypothetical protein WH47_09985 [Habropoda laboriosa]|uniref:Uncharacterized protein n=1 Tax=Habropoda laboriosa TaxID=597456 RepID=A0A0L7R3T7_9HYME|nr:hypothetical protein WH47_09985 [Habropoda laboriosa]